MDLRLLLVCLQCLPIRESSPRHVVVRQLVGYFFSTFVIRQPVSRRPRNLHYGHLQYRVMELRCVTRFFRFVSGFVGHRVASLVNGLHTRSSRFFQVFLAGFVGRVLSAKQGPASTGALRSGHVMVFRGCQGGRQLGAESWFWWRGAVAWLLVGPRQFFV